MYHFSVHIFVLVYQLRKGRVVKFSKRAQGLYQKGLLDWQGFLLRYVHSKMQQLIKMINDEFRGFGKNFSSVIKRTKCTATANLSYFLQLPLNTSMIALFWSLAADRIISMAKAAGSGRCPRFSITTLPSNTMNPCPSKFLFLLHSNVDDNSRSIFYSLCGTFKSKVLEAVSD